MDLRKEMHRRIARAKARGDDRAVTMLEDRLEQLERPVSAELLFQSVPIVNRKNDDG